MITVQILWGLHWLYWLWSARKTEKVQLSESTWSRFHHLGHIVLAQVLLLDPNLPLGPLSNRFLPEESMAVPLGIAITAFSLFLSVWARVHLGKYWSGKITLKEGHRLIRTGPYAWVRHPIYTGQLFGAVGTALVLGKWQGVVALVLLVSAYARKILLEEKYLREHFGPEHEAYRAEVKTIIPFVW